ncbi:hypothetical protein N7486_007962 [Penicillium sp. IBT 16267x]|nr:hypothetical protein N7486_007962 [Penicillium sp. IBT 16267x]
MEPEPSRLSSNGAVIFIISINCRRTIPGGIAARGVIALPDRALEAPEARVPAPAPGPVGNVCRVLLVRPLAGGAVLPAIKGVELRIGRVEGSRGVERGSAGLADEVAERLEKGGLKLLG